jgi:hypothetical protein
MWYAGTRQSKERSHQDEVSHEAESIETRSQGCSSSVVAAGCWGASRCAKRLLRALHQRGQGGPGRDDGIGALGVVRSEGSARFASGRLPRRAYAQLGHLGRSPDRALASPRSGAGGGGGCASELRLGRTSRSAQCRDDRGDGRRRFLPALWHDARPSAADRGAILGVQELGVASLRRLERQATRGLAVAPDRR